MQHRRPLALLVVALGWVVACGGGETQQEAKVPKTERPKIACKEHPVVGHKAPDLTIHTMNGLGDVSIKPGKVTLVDFWAMWCAPCHDSFPAYQDLYTKYKASGLEIMAISVDGTDKVGEIPKFADATHAKFPIGWDSHGDNEEHGAVAQCFDPQSMPYAALIDKRGVVRFIHKGFRKEEVASLEKEIKSLL
jgi:peroxiredoxin